MKLSTTIQVPPGLMSKAPVAAAMKATVMAELRAGMQMIQDAGKAANPTTGDAFFSTPIDEGLRYGYGLGSSWPKWWTLEYNMPPHVIEARNAPALVFEGRDGHLVRVQSVNHPGHTGNHAIDSAVALYTPIIAAAVAAAGHRVAVTWGSGI